MKTEAKVAVKSAKKVVARIDVPVYESIDELVEALGSDKVLKLANTQNKTNMKNDARAAATGEPSKKALEEAAWAKITPEMLAAVTGDIEGIRNLLNTAKEEVQKELAEKKATAVAAVEDEVADEDEDLDFGDEDDEEEEG